VNARLLVTGLVVVIGALASTGTAAPTEEVTLRVDRYFDPMCNCIRARFTGTVSSGRPGEYVTVMQQRCGSGAQFSTAMAAATTGPGGHWEATPSTYYTAAPLLPGTFRARWKTHLSEPVAFRPPLRVTVRRERSGRYLTLVPAHATLRGEFLELQRLVGGQWKRVKYLRINPRNISYGGSYWAKFAVRTKGWTMRVFAPPDTTAPCYTAGATQTFRS
jgi:hypothetical protein